ncbi:hypothetical protein MJT46_007440 [Ovis ammon polii x Ovis aries]|nr:hypothetical protein MJT46_007440 [Ovis ammon polii x Ovis aries]
MDEKVQRGEHQTAPSPPLCQQEAHLTQPVGTDADMTSQHKAGTPEILVFPSPTQGPNMPTRSKILLHQRAIPADALLFSNNSAETEKQENEISHSGNQKEIENRIQGWCLRSQTLVLLRSPTHHQQKRQHLPACLLILPPSPITSIYECVSKYLPLYIHPWALNSNPSFDLELKKH